MIAAGGGTNDRYGVSGWLAGAFSVIAGAGREGGRERAIVESKTALVFGTSAWRNSYGPPPIVHSRPAVQNPTCAFPESGGKNGSSTPAGGCPPKPLVASLPVVPTAQAGGDTRNR